MKPFKDNQRLIEEYFIRMQSEVTKRLRLARIVPTLLTIQSAILQIIKQSQQVSSTTKQFRTLRQSISNKQNSKSQANQATANNHSQTQHQNLFSTLLSRDSTNETFKNRNVMTDLIQFNQEKIITQHQNRGYVKRQREIQHQVAKFFVKEWLKGHPESEQTSIDWESVKDKEKGHQVNSFNRKSTRTQQRESFKYKLYTEKHTTNQCVNELSNKQTQPNYISISIDGEQSVSNLKLFEVPISSIQVTEFQDGKQKNQKRFQRAQCLSQRGMLSNGRLYQSQFIKQIDQEAEKIKAFRRLRKLQKFVFQSKDNKEIRTLSRKGSTQHYHDQFPIEVHRQNKVHSLNTVHLDSNIIIQKQGQQKKENQLQGSLRKIQRTVNRQQARVITKKYSLRAL